MNLKKALAKKKKRKKMINNETIIRSTAIAANVRAALRSCCILKPNASLKNKF